MPTDKQQFLLLPEEERKEILQTLGTKRGQSPAVLEKDVWVCWALKTLFEIPQPHSMAFKGGTSLSKVFNVIERFSEDIDVTLDYKSLLPTAEPFHPETSKTQIKKLAEQLRGLVCTHTNEVILPAFKSALKEQFGAEAYDIELSEDGEILSVQYKLRSFRPTISESRSSSSLVVETQLLRAERLLSPLILPKTFLNLCFPKLL